MILVRFWMFYVLKSNKPYECLAFRRKKVSKNGTFLFRLRTLSKYRTDWKWDRSWTSENKTSSDFGRWLYLVYQIYLVFFPSVISASILSQNFDWNHFRRWKIRRRNQVDYYFYLFQRSSFSNPIRLFINYVGAVHWLRNVILTVFFHNKDVRLFSIK